MTEGQVDEIIRVLLEISNNLDELNEGIHIMLEKL